jgi:D,D-heptose 1,7-bisphosphate phosphatase
MKPAQAVILCGGLGTRLGSRTATTPKPLLEVGGAPFLDVLLFEIGRHGVKDVLLLAGFAADKVRDYARTTPVARRFGLNVTVAVEPSPAGTGGALKVAEALLAPEFLLLNGDTWFDVNLLDLTPDIGRRWLVSMCLRKVDDASRYGVVRTDGGVVTAMAEKPPGRNAGVINGGVSLVRREVAQFLTDHCSLESDVLPDLVRRSLVAGRVHDGYFIDIGIPADLERAQTEIPAFRRRPAAFLDRDGVLNLDSGYVGRSDQWRWVEGAQAAVKRFNALGWYVFVVTNQAGIARGYYGEDDVAALHRDVFAQLAEHGAHVDDLRICPFHVDGTVERYRRDSDWRKPQPGMLLDLMQHWPVAQASSVMVGDQESDMEAARRAGIAGLLFPGGRLDSFLSERLGLARQG